LARVDLFHSNSKSLFSLKDASKEKFLRDGWEFNKWLDSERISENDKRQFRHMLLFMLFPSEFGRIFSAGDRRGVVQKFRNLEPAEIKKMSALEIDQEISKTTEELKYEHGVTRIDLGITNLS
jgi:5-methylcytosine-specific restriction protein B